MISIIEKEIVDKYGWLDREEFLDLLAVAQSLPGILAVNIAVAIGDRLRGLKGSVTAALATILPSFIMILVIAVVLTPDLIKSNPALSAIFRGTTALIKKFCPSPFEKEKPCFSKSGRRVFKSVSAILAPFRRPGTVP